MPNESYNSIALRRAKYTNPISEVSKIAYALPERAQITPEQRQLIKEAHPHSLWLAEVFDNNFARSYWKIMANAKFEVDMVYFKFGISQNPPVLPVIVKYDGNSNIPPKNKYELAIIEWLKKRKKQGERSGDPVVFVTSVVESSFLS